MKLERIGTGGSHRLGLVLSKGPSQLIDCLKSSLVEKARFTLMNLTPRLVITILFSSSTEIIMTI